MEITKYYIIGVRPVKTVKYTNGGFEILAFNWDTGVFELNSRYIKHIFGFYTGDVETVEITKKDFDKYVVKLKMEKGIN